MLCYVLQTAKARYVPPSRIPKTRPEFPSGASSMAHSNNIRQENPTYPRIHELNNKINELVNDHKPTKRQKHLMDSNFNGGTKNFWKEKLIDNFNSRCLRRNQSLLTFSLKYPAT